MRFDFAQRERALVFVADGFPENPPPAPIPPFRLSERGSGSEEKVAGAAGRAGSLALPQPRPPSIQRSSGFIGVIHTIPATT